MHMDNKSLSPAEIQALFPIGKILELSAQARAKIIFLTEIMNSTMFIHDLILKDENIKPEDIKGIILKTFDIDPWKSMTSVAMGGGWDSPFCEYVAISNITLMKNLVWAIVYSEVVKTYNICRKDWLSLKMEILEKPMAGGILIQGYEFSAKDLGHDSKAICPDYPPA